MTITGQDLLIWPTVKLVCSQVKDKNGDKVYQGAVLPNYSPMILKACTDLALADVKQLGKTMKV